MRKLPSYDVTGALVEGNRTFADVCGLLAVLLVLGALLVGCGKDPCRNMERTAPPEAQVLMKQGYEVSKEVHDDLECELQESGRWERDA